MNLNNVMNYKEKDMGNKPRVKVLIYNVRETGRGDPTFIKAILYNNNFIYSYTLTKKDDLYYAIFQGQHGEASIENVLKKRKDDLHTLPIIGGYCTPSPTVRAIMEKDNRHIKVIDQIALGTYILEKVVYYGKIEKIIKAHEQLEGRYKGEGTSYPNFA